MTDRKYGFNPIWVFALLAATIVFSCQKGSPDLAYKWVTIDESYVPQNYVEQFLKNDSESRGFFPIYIKNYDQDKNVLRRFRGTILARPNEAALKIAFPGLEDWMLIDLKYENEKKQEVLRTILYVNIQGTWKVGDSGRLLKK